MSKNISKAVALKHIFDNISVNIATGCWEWLGSKTKDGYGQLSRDKIVQSFGVKGVHRLTKMLIDDWVPESRHEQTRHICSNRACCNPDHLQTGSALDNAADRRRDGTILTGEASPNAKLSDADVRAIRKAAANGEKMKDLANQYNVCQQHISSIIAGKHRAMVMS